MFEGKQKHEDKVEKMAQWHGGCNLQYQTRIQFAPLYVEGMGTF